MWLTYKMSPLIVYISLIVLGIFLLIACGEIRKNTATLPPSSHVVRANEGLYTMGIIFLTAGLVLMAAGPAVHVLDTTMLTALMGFIMVLGVILIVLSAIVMRGTSGGARTMSTLVLVLGVIFIGVTGTVLARSGYKKYYPGASPAAEFGCGMNY